MERQPKVKQSKQSFSTNNALWKDMLTGVHPSLRKGRRMLKFLPSNPRCKMCNAPFAGIGSLVSHWMKKYPSKKNPHFCNTCELFAKDYPGGAEIELTMLFADVRGSTTLAEKMTSTQFSKLMNRFYLEANDVLIKTDALIDKLVGDEVIGLYLPAFSGPDHALKAIQAAHELVHATGHGSGKTWLPIGVGVHTGKAYVGAVGTKDGFYDFTALGDAVNITARLASAAGPGEILVSSETFKAAKLDLENLEKRRLKLKGKSKPVEVRVIAVTD